MQKYAKGIVAVIGAVLITALSIWGDVPALVMAASFVTAFGVYLAPNLPE